MARVQRRLDALRPRLLVETIPSGCGHGIYVGLAVSMAVGRIYRAFQCGLVESESLLMSAALAIVVLFALAAALVPAWRATHFGSASVFAAASALRARIWWAQISAATLTELCSIWRRRRVGFGENASY